MDAPDTQAVVALFDALAPVYDGPEQRHFAFAADRLVHHLAPRRGQRVLDLCTGTGLVATALAQAVGPLGRVHGVDLSEAMLEQAEVKLRHLGLGNVDLHHMDAARPAFRAGYFDAAACGFGLFLLADMEEALRRWRRALRPGGNLVFSSFAEGAFAPLAELLAEQLTAAGVTVPPPPWRRLADPRRCTQLLEAAGFTQVAVQKERLGYHLPDPEAWWTFVENTGFRDLLLRLPSEERPRFKREHLHRVSRFQGDKGLWLEVPVLFARGRRPQ